MRRPYILGCNDSLHCFNGVRHKMSFVNILSIEKLLPWFSVSSFHFDLFCSHFVFFWLMSLSSSFSVSSERRLLPLTDDCNLYSWGPLDPDRKKKKNLQAVNELPSMSSVKGVYKLTEALPELSPSFLLLPPIPSTPYPHQPLHQSHAVSPALPFSPRTCLLHTPAAPWREQSCLAPALSSTHCLRSSCLELAV